MFAQTVNIKFSRAEGISKRLKFLLHLELKFIFDIKRFLKCRFKGILNYVQTCTRNIVLSFIHMFFLFVLSSLRKFSNLSSPLAKFGLSSHIIPDLFTQHIQQVSYCENIH